MPRLLPETCKVGESILLLGPADNTWNSESAPCIGVVDVPASRACEGSAYKPVDSIPPAARQEAEQKSVMAFKCTS